MDKHIIEALGKSQITIENGKVTNITLPEVTYCPLFHNHRGIEELNKETIKENIEFRINDFGFCTPQRKIRMKDFLSFGVSETISTLLKENLIDATIMVCDGCGTVIITDPEIAQGVGGRVSGFISTTPIQETIKKIGEKNVLNTETAIIDQIQGVQKAINMGYKKLAVSVVSPEQAQELRKIEKETQTQIYIFAVHTTALTRKDAEQLINTCDILTACASKHIRELSQEKGIFSAGASIPIYAPTNKGEEFLKLRIEKIGGIKHKENPQIPDPLI